MSKERVVRIVGTEFNLPPGEYQGELNYVKVYNNGEGEELYIAFTLDEDQSQVGGKEKRMNRGDMPAQPQDEALWVQQHGRCCTEGTGLTIREEAETRFVQSLLSNPAIIDNLPRQDDGTAQWFADTARMFAHTLINDWEIG